MSMKGTNPYMEEDEANAYGKVFTIRLRAIFVSNVSMCLIILPSSLDYLQEII